jgi:hypothetical protein
MSSRSCARAIGRLQRRVEEAGAVPLARRRALELVLLAALLAAHAEVAVKAAQRQPLAAGHLEARLALGRTVFDLSVSAGPWASEGEGGREKTETENKGGAGAL